MSKRKTQLFLVFLVCLLCLASAPFIASAQENNNNHSQQRHVLLLSIDGLHAQDLALYTRIHPHSALASLGKWGVTYTNASTTKPSDSFPGLLSMVTGGTPRSTGVFYDDSYDGNLSAPGSNCSTKGTEVVYDESIDYNSDALNAGGGINPQALPLDPAKGCTPVYPHSFLRVNTIFEVAHQAGLRTAWSDKHPAYDILNGPSGKGVDDLYSPEIAAIPTTVPATETYDDSKVQIILNQIDGKDHSGTHTVGVPSLFGMNFQAVSVAQKAADGGYTDSIGTPSAALWNALDHTDQSIGKFVSELRKNGLLSSTVIIVTAKHGQSPIDPSKRQIIDKKLIPNLVNSVQSNLLAQATQDDVSLLWLTDKSKVNAVVATLSAHQAEAGIQQILAGDSLKLLFNDPKTDARTPDIVLLPYQGVIYASPTATKIAEHGGFSEPDTHVALLIANPGLSQKHVYASVATTQIAPTILQLLGLDPNRLQAVRQEQTQALPGLDFD